MTTRAARDRVLLACLFAVLLPFAVGLACVLSGHWTPTGDWALLELRARGVGGSHTPLVGPYSRFGWSHPGPALFFVLAVPYRLLGSRPDGLLVAALLVNAASAAGLVLLAWRRGGRAYALTMAIAVGILCRALGGEFLRDPWNPFITVLPFALFLLLVWSVVCGDAWFLPVAMLVASFIVQSHVGYAALVAAALAAALVWWLVRVWLARRAGPDRVTNRRRASAVFGATFAVTVVAWVPPLIDQIVNPGNLLAIWHFFTKRQETPTPQTAFRLVGNALSIPALWITGHDSVQTSDFTTIVVGSVVPLGLIALVAALVVAAVRRDREPSALAVLVLAALAAGVYSISHIAGPLAGYLVRWLLVLGMLTWVAALWGFWPLLRRVRAGRGVRIGLGALAVAGLVVPAALGVDSAVRARPPWSRLGGVERGLERQTLAHLRPDGHPVLLTSDHDYFFTWGLAPRLEAAGIPVAASPNDVLYYGRHRVARLDDARRAVVVVTGRGARTTDRPPNSRLLAWYPGTRVFRNLPKHASYYDAIHAAEANLLSDPIAVYELPLPH